MVVPTAKTSISARFGRALASYRKETGQSQEELAHRAGIHRTYVSDIERGRKSPTLEVVDALARALGTSAIELLRKAELESE